MRGDVIVGAVRTPVASATADCAEQHAADLSAVVLNELAAAPGWTPNRRRRGVGLRFAGRRPVQQHRRFSCWPPAGPSTPGTVNRACGSSQQALDFAVQAVMSGQQDVVVAGGVEVMSPMLGAACATGMPYGPKALLPGGDGFQFNQAPAPR